MLDKTKVEMLRRAFIDVVQEIRGAFSDHDIRNFHVVLRAKGRTFNGEAAVTATVSTDEYGSDSTSSPNLDAAFREALRRKGFDVQNEALALPAPGTELEEELGRGWENLEDRPF